MNKNENTSFQKEPTWTCKCGNNRKAEGFSLLDMNWNPNSAIKSKLILCKRCGEIECSNTIDIMLGDDKKRQSRKEKLDNINIQNDREEEEHER